VKVEINKTESPDPKKRITDPDPGSEKKTGKTDTGT
jgi:hypothetical protein